MSGKARVVMQKADQWREQVSFYRFWNNEKVTGEALTQCMEDHCREQRAGLEEAVLAEDTSEMNLESHRKRIKDRAGLGTVGNGKDLGFFCHPTVVTEPVKQTAAGATDLMLWAREGEPEGKGGKGKRPARKPLEEKESYRRAERAAIGRERLSGVPRVTVVQDREGGSGRASEYLAGKEAAGSYGIEAARRGEKKRSVKREVRFGKVTVEQPAGRVKEERQKYPGEIEMYVVQAKEEKGAGAADGKKEINWTLYTSREVETMEDALKAIEYYKSRWLTEDLFRTVKSERVNYEASELERGGALRKLFAMAFMAALQILQLRQARDGNSGQKRGLVFDGEQVECMEKLLSGFEGKTEKQKNPYAKEDLAWAAWIIGRLGGWKTCSVNRPPGVITLREGMERFQNIFTGWLIAKRCV